MQKRGFTIIELLIAMSIMALLFGIGAAKYVSFNQGQIIKQAAQKLRSDLRVGVNKAITGEKNGCGTLDGYQVSFTSGQYSLSSACSGGTFRAVNAVNLPSGVSFNPLPSPLFFKVLGQGVSSATTIILSGFSKTETITVNISGEIQ